MVRIYFDVKIDAPDYKKRKNKVKRGARNFYDYLRLRLGPIKILMNIADSAARRVNGRV